MGESAMTAFAEAQAIGARGTRDVIRFLDGLLFEGRYVVTDKGPLSQFLQHSVGDALYNSPDGRIWGVEVKTERRTTGNMFLETWSNRTRLTHGWLHTLTADVLAYMFLDTRVLCLVPMKPLQQWAFGTGEGPGHLYQYPEKKQRIFDQLNDTWGRCVPIDVIARDVGCQQYVVPSYSIDGTAFADECAIP